MRENGARAPESRRTSRSSQAIDEVAAQEQHRQPDGMRITSPSIASNKRWSSPTSPHSLTITSVSASSRAWSRRLISVVLPEPRKPVTTCSGIDGDRPIALAAALAADSAALCALARLGRHRAHVGCRAPSAQPVARSAIDGAAVRFSLIWLSCDGSAIPLVDPANASLAGAKPRAPKKITKREIESL